MKISSLILVVMLCVGCSADSSRTYAMGNTPGNAREGGYAAEYEGYIYYVNRTIFYGDFHALYRVDLARTEKQLITTDKVWALNILDGWIYYSLDYDGTGIYKMRIDGTQKTQLSDDYVRTMIVRGEEIYYTNDDYELFKMDIYGNNKMRLHNRLRPRFSLHGDWIYTNQVELADDGEIDLFPIKLKCDGSETKTILGPEDTFLLLVDEWIYFLNMDDGKVYRERLDGKEKQLLIEDPYYSLNVHGDWIYYSNDADGGNLYRVYKDGTQKTMIYDGPASGINIVGDSLFFITPVEDVYTLEQLGLDGLLIDYYRIPLTTPSPSPIR